MLAIIFAFGACVLLGILLLKSRGKQVNVSLPEASHVMREAQALAEERAAQRETVGNSIASRLGRKVIDLYDRVEREASAQSTVARYPSRQPDAELRKLARELREFEDNLMRVTWSCSPALSHAAHSSRRRVQYAVSLYDKGVEKLPTARDHLLEAAKDFRRALSQ